MPGTCKKIEDSPLYVYKDVDDPVNHPNHYCKPGQVECINQMEIIFGQEAVRHFCLLNAYKYIERCRDKGHYKQDLEKAIWYLKKFDSYHIDDKQLQNTIMFDDAKNRWNITELLFEVKVQLSRIDLNPYLSDRNGMNHVYINIVIGILSFLIYKYNENGENLED